jgi:predicted  nucleic acid-binding Zn-ribbon protein
LIDQLRHLHEVQKLDTLIGDYTTQQAALDDGTALRAQLAGLEAELAVEQEKLHPLETDLRDTELKLQSTEEERKKFRTKLYSGSIIMPKELQDVQDKIESLTNRKGSLEERGLVLLDEVEAQSTEVKKRSKAADEVRTRLASVEKRFKEATARLTGLIADLRAQREPALRPLDASLLAKYEKIREKHQNLGIVLVQSDVCAGCHTQITPASLKKLQDPQTVLLCDSCNRIFYRPPAPMTDADADGADLDGAGDTDGQEPR